MKETEIFTMPEDMVRLRDAGYDISKARFAWQVANTPEEYLTIMYNNKYNRDRWGDVMIPTFSFQELQDLMPKNFASRETEGKDPAIDLDYEPSFGPGTEVKFVGQGGEYILETFEENTLNKSMAEALLWLKKHPEFYDINQDY